MCSRVWEVKGLLGLCGGGLVICCGCLFGVGNVEVGARLKEEDARGIRLVVVDVFICRFGFGVLLRRKGVMLPNICV